MSKDKQPVIQQFDEHVTSVAPHLLTGKEAKAVRTKAPQDPEILAMSRIFRVLATLTPAAAERVAEYVANKTHEAVLESAQQFDGNG